MLKEVWKNIDGYEGYQVSNKGRVRSQLNNRYGFSDKVKPHLLSPCKNHHGYDTVQLGRKNRKLVHRLVANAFIPNPDNLPIVRHMDDNPSNNNVNNLAWGTQTDNMQDCVKHRRLVGNIWPAIESNKKPIIAKNIKTCEILKFKSCSDAGRYLNIPIASISKVICGLMRQSHGWEFEALESKGRDYNERSN